MNDKILNNLKSGDRAIVRDVKNHQWDVWYTATVVKIIRTDRSHSVQLYYEDIKGITQNVTSCVIGGIVRAHDADIANALYHA